MAPLIALSLVTVAAVSTTSVLARPAVHWSLQHNSNKVAQLDNAHAGPRLSILAPSTVSKTSPFASLTADDAKSVVDYLHSLPELNLTAYDQAEDWDNRITGIDLVFPAKSPAIEYLDGSVSPSFEGPNANSLRADSRVWQGSVPPRFAKVDVRCEPLYSVRWAAQLLTSLSSSSHRRTLCRTVACGTAAYWSRNESRALHFGLYEKFESYPHLLGRLCADERLCAS